MAQRFEIVFKQHQFLGFFSTKLLKMFPTATEIYYVLHCSLPAILVVFETHIPGYRTKNRQKIFEQLQFQDYSVKILLKSLMIANTIEYVRDWSLAVMPKLV